MQGGMFSPHGPGNEASHHQSPHHGGPFSQFSNHPHGQQNSPRGNVGPHNMGVSPMHAGHGPPSVGGMPFESREAFLAANRHRVQEGAPAPIPNNDISSLLINLAMSDSLMNLFKDHNFESCTLCVCNMNLKGSDVGIYLPDALIPGIYDESQYKCTCGFSAVVNRHRSALSGLFYEDEIEITGIVYDPTEGLVKTDVLALDAPAVKPKSDLLSLKSENDSPNLPEADPLSPLLVELVRTQCSTLLSSCSLFSKALVYDLHLKALSVARKITTNDKSQFILSGLKVVSKMALLGSPDAIFRSDSSELAYLALISGKNALETYPPKLVTQQIADKRALKGSCLHDWQFLATEIPANNHEAVRFLRSLQPLLQESVQKKPQAMWEVTYSVSGPLTWRQFHRLAGRGTEDQCEPQPIPSLMVGHDKDWVCVSPFALKYWEKLMLEPYTVTRDVAYLVVAPDNSAVLPHVRSFFKELSTTYEMLRLGKHCPIVKILRDGIMRVGSSKKVAEEQIDDWFNQIGDSSVTAKLKLYAQSCKAYLAPLIKAQPLDKTLFAETPAQKTQPPTETNAGSTPSNSNPNYKPPSAGPGNDNSASNDATKMNYNDDDRNEGPNHGLPSFSTMAQIDHEEEDPAKQPAIVIYIVEPFTFANLDETTYRLASLGLLRCYSQMLKCLPENVQSCINLQIVSLDAICSTGADFRQCTRQEQLKSLAFAVFSQSRKSVVNPTIHKSLTGFGPAASLGTFLKEHPSGRPNRLYAPPYILAPLKDKNTELGHMFGDQREKSHNLYVCYCLTEDQKWIVASCSNERGDILETTLISIEVPNRTKRRKATVRRLGLQKLMKFILSVMSETVQPWRLVVGRLGRVGHGELREWASLLSKKALLRFSKNMKDTCDQCTSVSPYEVPGILSACLVSLEADTALRVFSDQYTPDDRFSSSCNTCSLSTPEDATCTHILTFPTSTTTQSSQGSFQIDAIGAGLGDDDLLQALGGTDTDDLGMGDDGMNLFDWGDPDDPVPVSPGDGGHGFASGMPDSPGSRQVGFDGSASKVRVR